jgi:hypothetical protein
MWPPWRDRVAGEMTLVVINPEHLERAASVLDHAAGDYVGWPPKEARRRERQTNTLFESR